jgi:transposase
LRYPSDVTDEEWELIVPLIPPGKSGGGKRTVIMRERLSVARNPERPAAEKHGLRLFRSVDL